MAEEKNQQLSSDNVPFNNMIQSVWIKVEQNDDETEDGINGDDGVNDDDGSTDDEENNDTDEETAPPAVDVDQKKNAVKRKRKKPEVNLFCQFCDYKTAYKRCLTSHLYNHTNIQKPFSCDLCSYATKHPATLQRHIIGQHKAKEDESIFPTYTCSECPYKSIFKSNLAAHKRKHSIDKQFKCDTCDFSTAYKHNFLKHNRSHQHKDKMTYQCEKCPFVARSEGYIIRHLSQVHHEVMGEVNKCENCNFLTKVRWRLNIHRKRSLQVNPIKCENCDLLFMYMCELKLHRASHKNPKADPIIYALNADNPDINKIYQPNKPVQNTQKVTIDGEIEWKNILVDEFPGDEKPFRCIMCEYSSKFKSSVQRHFQRHHTESHIKPFKCENCGFSTKTKDQMSLHNKRSKVEAIILCNICDYSTKFKCQFVNHQKSHNPFKCKLCDYTCRCKYYIQKHYATIHQGVEGIMQF